MLPYSRRDVTPKPARAIDLHPRDFTPSRQRWSSGSVTSFNLNITKRGVLTAKCPDGKLQAKASAIFSDGTKASAGIIRTCTGT